MSKLDMIIKLLILACLILISYTITRQAFTERVIERHTYYLMPDKANCEVPEMHLKLVKAKH